MQLLKKRLSVHRTSRNLRSLWDEYALQINAEGQERDSSRLLALSSFMDNIFDVGQPFEPTLKLNFDDTDVVVTGLLNVARRASIQLLTEDKEDVDRTTLQEALRKALMVARLCLKKCANRENINQVPHIVSLILAILENVTSVDDKILSLQILGCIMQYEESRLELCRLGGLKLMCSLGSFALQTHSIDLSLQIVIALCQYLAPVQPFKQQSLFVRNSGVLSEKQDTNATLPRQSPYSHSISSSQLFATDLSSYSCEAKSVRLGSDLEDSGDKITQGHTQEQDSSPPSILLWPPRPSTTYTHRNSMCIDLSVTASRQDIANHPSTSLAAKGVNMATNVVNDILRMAPIATSSLHRDLATLGRDRRDMTGAESCESRPDLEQIDIEMDEEVVFGGVDIVPPITWRNFECNRLNANVAKEVPVVSGDAHLYDDPTTEEVVILLINFLKAVVRTDKTEADETCNVIMPLKGQISLLLCAMNLLLYSKSALECFNRLAGYDALQGAIIQVNDEIGLNYFLLLHSSDVDDDAYTGCLQDGTKINIALLLLSLIFCQPLNADVVEAYGEMSYAKAVRHHLLVKNTRALDLVVALVNSGQSSNIVAGLNVLKSMLGLCPLSVVALESCGGLIALGNVVVQRSMIAYPNLWSLLLSLFETILL